jgi:hypothetical protein
MDGVPLTLADAPLLARASGALWWPGERTLVAADLHLGRSERIARNGGSLLPPYETRETLDRLAAEIAALAPRRVICLGDSFDDEAAAGALGWEERSRLHALSAGRRLIWVAGNHDPAPLDMPGEHRAELALGGLVFRHAARADPGGAEVSGHWHPKLTLSLGGRGLTRPCFLTDGRRLILPAFGTYTGGLSARHAAIRGLLGPGALAILTGRPALAVPLAPQPEDTPA